MFPVIILTGWHGALVLMREGWWAVRLRPGVFAATPAAPRPGPIVLQVSFARMSELIRHGWECSRLWRCTGSQIGG